MVFIFSFGLLLIIFNYILLSAQLKVALLNLIIIFPISVNISVAWNEYDLFSHYFFCV